MSDSPITKLPDGSAFFTSTILSNDEAMALPPEKRPLNYRVSSEIYVATFEAIGAASLCWEPKPSTEVFDSEKASQFAVELLFKFAGEMDKKNEEIKAMREMVSRFLVANRDTHKSWIEAFVECGAVKVDWNYHPLYPFIEPKK